MGALPAGVVAGRCTVGSLHRSRRPRCREADGPCCAGGGDRLRAPAWRCRRARAGLRAASRAVVNLASGPWRTQGSPLGGSPRGRGSSPARTSCRACRARPVWVTSVVHRWSAEHWRGDRSESCDRELRWAASWRQASSKGVSSITICLWGTLSSCRLPGSFGVGRTSGCRAHVVAGSCLWSPERRWRDCCEAFGGPACFIGSSVLVCRLYLRLVGSFELSGTSDLVGRGRASSFRLGCASTGARSWDGPLAAQLDCTLAVDFGDGTELFLHLPMTTSKGGFGRHSCVTEPVGISRVQAAVPLCMDSGKPQCARVHDGRPSFFADLERR